MVHTRKSRLNGNSQFLQTRAAPVSLNVEVVAGRVGWIWDYVPFGMKPGLPVFTTSLNLCLV